MRLQKVADGLFVHHSVASYLVNLTVATRSPERYGLAHLAGAIELGVSPRASLGMLAAGRALALLRGRSYVLPADIVEIASDVMSHRLLLSFDAVADGADPREIVREVIAAVPQPSVASREDPDAHRAPAPTPTARCRRLRASTRSTRDLPQPPTSLPSTAASSPQAVFAALDLAVRRRLPGRMHGDHQGLRLGSGSEPEEVVRYRPGEDDVRRIDWNVTARSAGVPHVWRLLAQHELETWVLVDDTPSMAFGTIALEKRDIAAGVTAAVALLTAGPGNRLGTAHLTDVRPGVGGSGAVAGRGSPGAAPTLRAARGHLRRRRPPTSPARCTASPRATPAPAYGSSSPTSSTPTGASERPFAWERPLRRLAAAHEVLVVEVVDPRELTLPDVGTVTLVDPESGRRREVWTSDRRTRERYAAMTAAHRVATAEAVALGARRPRAAAHRPRLGARPRPPRARAAAEARRPRPRRAGGRVMSLASPGWLLLLLPVAALLASYLIQAKRRSRYAVTFATLPMLERLTPEKPGWRRHLPATFLLLTFVVLCVAAARPQVDEQVPRERATVIVVIDVSLSMQATDVSPDRLTAASQAAQDFVDGLPEGFNVGVVSFAGSATVLASPSNDHAASVAALSQLRLDEGTAIGDGVMTSLAQIETTAATDGTGLDADVPAQIVLLSDGTNTVGSSIDQAASAAIEAQVPVSTIAYGTDNGSVIVDGTVVQVPVDQNSLDELAMATGGTGYAAATADQLDQVYDDIQSSIGFTTEQRDVTPYVIAVALLLGLLAAAMSLRWFARLP